MNRFRPLLAIAVPIISARLVQNLGLFVGSLMVAQLGKAALAASAIATSLSLTLFTFASSSLMILAPLLSGMRHPEAHQERTRTLRQGFLMATAMGLAAAIPAVLAYNKLSTDAAKLGSRMDGFADEFAAILSRQIDDRS